MRELRPKLTPELIAHCNGAPVWKAPAFAISTFRKLVEHVARLAYVNPDDLLFFRGQSDDYQSKAGGTTLYPAIYRGDSIPAPELAHKFTVLDQACRRLVDRFKSAGIEGHKELRQKRYIQWSILQHYEVVATPLLDLTQSLRVACSFAHLGATQPMSYVYVFGLPYITNRISINSEHDIVNVRLLSICPPAALRPYFQEGCLAGTPDVSTEFDSKTELDFRNRLIAKFAIPSASAFWGRGFEQIPEASLYPKGDLIRDLCGDLKESLKDELVPGELGEFVRVWADIEGILVENGRAVATKNISVREAIIVLIAQKKLKPELMRTLDGLRRFRNDAVHKPATINSGSLRDWKDTAEKVLRELRGTAKLQITASVGGSR